MRGAPRELGEERPGRLVAQLGVVASGELAEARGVVSEPLPQRGGRRELLLPAVEPQRFLLDASRPQPVDEDAVAVAVRRLLVCTLDPDPLPLPAGAVGRQELGPRATERRSSRARRRWSSSSSARRRRESFSRAAPIVTRELLAAEVVVVDAALVAPPSAEQPAAARLVRLRVDRGAGVRAGISPHPAPRTPGRGRLRPVGTVHMLVERRCSVSGRTAEGAAGRQDVVGDRVSVAFAAKS